MSTPHDVLATRTSRRVLTGALAAAWLVACAVTLGHAQAARTVRDGVFTAAQAARGQAIYDKQCATCHGGALEGAQGPPLVGNAFVSIWARQPLSELASKIRFTMPADAAGTLTPQRAGRLLLR